ncbi:MAG TPA: hypothetical protein VKY74_17540, partial [Chloroflexia bacterium]|nr:hypothetical protein [Chloroflexia bacterium]
MPAFPLARAGTIAILLLLAIGGSLAVAAAPAAGLPAVPHAVLPPPGCGTWALRAEYPSANGGIVGSAVVGYAGFLY